MCQKCNCCDCECSECCPEEDRTPMDLSKVPEPMRSTIISHIKAQCEQMERNMKVVRLLKEKGHVTFSHDAK